MTRTWRTRSVAAAAAITLLVAACGDDDDDDASVEASPAAERTGDVAAYCAAIEDLESTDADPTVEQMEAIRASLPDEIRQEGEFVVDRFVEAIEAGDLESVFGDPEVNDRLEETIEPFEEENCPNLAGDGEAAVDIAPEHEEYCELALVFEEQEDFPSNEQLQEMIDVAPEEIAADVELAGGAFIERGEEAFEDPAVGEAIERIDAFDRESCGIGAGIGDLGASTEPEAGARQVAVTTVDYDFEFDPPSAGRTTFTMTNEGAETHFMHLIRLADGVTFEEAYEAEGEDGTVDAEASSDEADPGQGAVLTVDLEPGDYALACFIATPEGEVHSDLGMVVPFTVGGS